MLNLLFLIFTLSFASASDSFSPALIIMTCKNSGGAEVDHKTMADFFQEQGFEIINMPCDLKTVVNAKNILSAHFLELRQSIFYYSGHGALVPNADKFDFLTEDNIAFDAIDFLTQLPPSTYLWIDACYSGFLAQKLNNPAIYSSLGTETSSSSPLIGAIFTQNILTRIGAIPTPLDQNKDGRITFTELQEDILSDPFYYGFDHRLIYNPNRSYVRTPEVKANSLVADIILQFK